MALHISDDRPTHFLIETRQRFRMSMRPVLFEILDRHVRFSMHEQSQLDNFGLLRTWSG